MWVMALVPDLDRTFHNFFNLFAKSLAASSFSLTSEPPHSAAARTSLWAFKCPSVFCEDLPLSLTFRNSAPTLHPRCPKLDQSWFWSASLSVHAYVPESCKTSGCDLGPSRSALGQVMLPSEATVKSKSVFILNFPWGSPTRSLIVLL